ncbi:hypothetical protein HY310_00735 [Candidatus Microgenomates bacterium]|nr:hypothetical protein [Candidatus Microgenomates bacterium]
MITNKIVSLLITITSIITIPIQMVSTLVLGLLVSLSFGLLLLPISFVWAVVFLFPLLGLSYLWERISIIRPLISIVGIPFCQTFPYTWRFNQYYFNKLSISDSDVLNVIFKEIMTATPLRQYLEKIKQIKMLNNDKIQTSSSN